MKTFERELKVTTDYGMYFFADEWSPPGEEIVFEDDMGLSVGRLTGFLGMRTPWSAIVLCGARFGPIRLTIEVHDSRVEFDYDEWSEVIEVEFRSRSGDLGVRKWDSEPVTTLEGLLPPGRWCLRACARGRDEATDAYAPDAEPVEEHLLQFWPGPSYGGIVLTRDRVGAHLRGEVVPEPLPRGRELMSSQEEYEQFEQSRGLILGLAAGMSIPVRMLLIDLLGEQLLIDMSAPNPPPKPPRPGSPPSHEDLMAAMTPSMLALDRAARRLHPELRVKATNDPTETNDDP